VNNGLNTGSSCQQIEDVDEDVCVDGWLGRSELKEVNDVSWVRV